MTKYCETFVFEILLEIMTKTFILKLVFVIFLVFKSITLKVSLQTSNFCCCWEYKMYVFS